MPRSTDSGIPHAEFSSGTKRPSAAETDRPALLAPDEPPPYAVLNPDGESPVVLLCEHASNRIPATLGDLGLSQRDRMRHIAWDIGAAALAQRLSARLDAALLLTNYSRLIIDCNRPLDAKSSIPQISEDSPIPGNFDISQANRQRRAQALFDPFHNAVTRHLDKRRAAGRPTIVLGVHSFTPVFLGTPRKWHVGMLYAEAGDLAGAMMNSLARQDAGLEIGDNAPYTIDPAEDYTVPVHADGRRLPGALIEVRQDLLSTWEEIEDWARMLSRAIDDAAAALRV